MAHLHPSRPARVLVVAAVAVAVVWPAAASAKAPTGNRTAIRFARRVERAMSRASAIRDHRRGYASYTAQQIGFEFMVGRRAPSGFRRAEESVLLLYSHGRAIGAIDSLHAGLLLPLSIVQSGRSSYASLVRGQGSCYYPQSNNLLVRSGARAYTVDGARFFRLRYRRRSVLVSYRFRFAPGLTAHETDTVSKRSRRVLSDTVRVTGRGGFSFSERLQYVSKPSLLPAPAPLCQRGA